MTAFALPPFLFSSLFPFDITLGNIMRVIYYSQRKLGPYHQEHEPFSFGRSIVA